MFAFAMLALAVVQDVAADSKSLLLKIYVGLAVVVVLLVVVVLRQRGQGGDGSFRMTSPTPPLTTAQPQASIRAVLAIVGLGVFAWYYFGGGLQKEAGRQMENITQQVAEDAVKQYGIVERQGDKMMMCVQAGMVSAAYLQAKNESQYQAWKATESRNCKTAGIPR